MSIRTNPTMKFPQTLTTSDFSNLTTSVTAGTYTRVFEKQVPAQQYLAWGTGAIQGGVDNRGILFIDIKDSTPSTIAGKVRLSVSDANYLNEKVIMEERTERLNATQTDRTLAQFLAENQIKVGEDSRLIISFKPDTTSTISVSNTTLTTPVTTYQ
jgi:hypothetical protein